MWKLSRMKGSVELLSTAMRTIDLELMFVNYVQFWINFHSFKLRYFHLTLTCSIFQSRKYGLIDKFPNFRVNNYFCQIPLQSVFEVLFNAFFFELLVACFLLASWRVRHGGSPLSASHRKCILLSDAECHIINNLLNELARAVLGNIGPQSWQYVLPRPRANIPKYGLAFG